MSDAFRYKSKPEYTVESVNAVINSMPPRVQEIVLHKTNSNLTYNEIGVMLNMSTSRVSQLYNKGLDYIRVTNENEELRGAKITGNSDIVVLGLTSRAYNALRRNGYTTVGEVVNLSYDDLHKMRYVGKGTAHEIVTVLCSKGFHIKGSENLVKHNNLKCSVVENSDIKIVPTMLNVIYNKCQRRFNVYGRDHACARCPYRGTNNTSCMFNTKPSDWALTVR